MKFSQVIKDWKKWHKSHHFFKVLAIILLVINLILFVSFAGFFVDFKFNHKFSGDLHNYNLYKFGEVNEDCAVKFGNDSAPVKIVQYSDLSSPFCRKFHDSVFDRLKEDYIDTGKVQFIIEESPQYKIHKNSLNVSNALLCAKEQDLGDEYYLEVADLKKKNEENLMNAAVEVDLDIVKFDDCMESQKYVETILLNSMKNKRIGIESMPTLVINDEIIDEVKPYPALKKIIEKELEKSS